MHRACIYSHAIVLPCVFVSLTVSISKRNNPGLMAKHGFLVIKGQEGCVCFIPNTLNSSSMQLDNNDKPIPFADQCINVKVFMVYKVSSVFKWYQKFYFPIAVRKSYAFVCITVCLQ